MAEKILLEFKIDSAGKQKQLDKLTQEITENRAALKKTNDQLKKNQITTEQHAQISNVLKLRIKELSTESRTLQRDILNENKAKQAAIGSNNRLRAQLSILTGQYNALSKEERETTQEGQKLTAQIKRLSDELKANERAIGDNRRNVGNYRSAFDGIVKVSGKIGTAITTALGPIGLAVTGINKLIDVGQKFVSGANTQLQAQAQLRNSLKGNAEAYNELTNQASELQNITLFGDEETIQAQAFAQSIIQNADATKQLTPLVQDLATKKGIDLKTAFEQVSKSFKNGTGELNEYGLQIDGAAGSSQRLDSITKALKSSFGGAAQEAAKAGSGPITQLKNTLGDIGEEIGKVILPILNALAKAFLFVAQRIIEGFGKAKPLIDGIRGTFAGLGAVALESFEKIKRGIDIFITNAKILALEGQKIFTFDDAAEAAIDRQLASLKAKKADIEAAGTDLGAVFKGAYEEKVEEIQVARRLAEQKQFEDAGKLAGSSFSEGFSNSAKEEIKKQFSGDINITEVINIAQSGLDSAEEDLKFIRAQTEQRIEILKKAEEQEKILAAENRAKGIEDERATTQKLLQIQRERLGLEAALLDEGSIEKLQKQRELAEVEAQIFEEKESRITEAVESAEKARIEAKKKAAEERRALEEAELMARQATVTAIKDSSQVIIDLFSVQTEAEKEQREQKKQAFKEQSALVKAAVITQKAAAVAEIGISAQKEIGKYWEAYAGIPVVGPIIAGGLTVATIARAAGAVSKIAGFDGGGFTGNEGIPDSNIPGRRITGYVHDNEFVASTDTINNPVFRPVIKSMDIYQRTGQLRPFADGGFSSRQIASNVASSIDVERLVRTTAENMPPPVVQVSDIDKGFNSRNKVRVRANQ